MIKLQLDVTKIDKAKLYKGEKGTYLNAVLIETPNSAYSQYMVVQETTKEEREAGIKGTIIGNGKVLKFEDKPAEDVPIQPEPSNDNFPEDPSDDGLPF